LLHTVMDFKECNLFGMIFILWAVRIETLYSTTLSSYLIYGFNFSSEKNMHRQAYPSSTLWLVKLWIHITDSCYYIYYKTRNYMYIYNLYTVYLTYQYCENQSDNLSTDEEKVQQQWWKVEWRTCNAVICFPIENKCCTISIVFPNLTIFALYLAQYPVSL